MGSFVFSAEGSFLSASVAPHGALPRSRCRSPPYTRKPVPVCVSTHRPRVSVIWGGGSVGFSVPQSCKEGAALFARPAIPCLLNFYNRHFSKHSFCMVTHRYSPLAIVSLFTGPVSPLGTERTLPDESWPPHSGSEQHQSVK